MCSTSSQPSSPPASTSWARSANEVRSPRTPRQIQPLE
jgi:hypothetical protein